MQSPQHADMEIADAAPHDPAAEGWKQDRNSPFAIAMGPIWYCGEGDGTLHGIRLDEHHTNAFGMAFGGMLMAFLDHFMAIQIRAVSPARKVTIQLHTNFMSAARVGDWIEGRTSIVRTTASLIFARGAITCDGRIVAASQGIWKIVKPRG